MSSHQHLYLSKHLVPLLFNDLFNSLEIQYILILVTCRYAPGLETLLLHSHTPRFFFPNVTQEAHLFATVCCGQRGRVAASHVDAAAIVTRLSRCPRDLLGLERSEVGAPMHVASRTAVVGSVHPKVIQNLIITYNYS